MIKNSKIYDTGNDGRGMGEGVYVGTAGGTSDKSDRVQITGNTIGGDKQLAINVTNYSASCHTTVYASNTVTGGRGLTNVAVAP